MAKELKLVLHMNGGTGKLSYAENSSLQKLIIQKSKHIVEESIREYYSLLLSQNSKCMNVADLGCSSGPNAFFAVKEIISSINRTCKHPPSLQIFLNDLINNDFNSLSKLLPDFYDELHKLEVGCINRSSCYVATVPGSFYGRLFPDHSIHFFHSSYSLHWLSQVPVGLESKSGEALNEKNIYIAETSSPNVRKAYMNQFENDFTTFLKMRSLELVNKGHMVLTIRCKNDEDDGYDICELLGNTLHDMVSMGVIEKRRLANCNVPSYSPSIEELKQIIETEDSFTLKRLETFKLKWDANNIVDGQSRGTYVATYMRAVYESILTSHFGENLMNDIFEMFGKNVSKYMKKGKGTLNNVTFQLVKKSK